jgi:hypothetical protein
MFHENMSWVKWNQECKFKGCLSQDTLFNSPPPINCYTCISKHQKLLIKLYDRMDYVIFIVADLPLLWSNNSLSYVQCIGIYKMITGLFRNYFLVKSRQIITKKWMLLRSPVCLFLCLVPFWFSTYVDTGLSPVKDGKWKHMFGTQNVEQKGLTIVSHLLRQGSSFFFFFRPKPKDCVVSYDTKENVEDFLEPKSQRLSKCVI